MAKLDKTNPNKELKHLKRGTRSKKFVCPTCNNKFKSMFFDTDSNGVCTAECGICGELGTEIVKAEEPPVKSGPTVVLVGSSEARKTIQECLKACGDNERSMIIDTLPASFNGETNHPSASIIPGGENAIYENNMTIRFDNDKAPGVKPGVPKKRFPFFGRK